MPTIGNIAQHIGPATFGTVMETNPTYSTTPGYMRNMGISDAYQFGTLAYTTTTNTSNLTYTPTNAAGPVGVVVIPAGSYIENFNVDVTTAFNAGTNNTISVAIAPTNGVAGTVVFQVVGTGVSIPIGRWALGVVGTNLACYSGSGANTNIPYWINSSNTQTTPTDMIVQAWFTGTGTGATTGACTIGVGYVLRNPDGSWYQQTPTYPITNPPVITY